MAAQKKTLTAAERDPAERARFRAATAAVDPARLVFVDEAGTHTAMTRRRARAPRGRRAYGSVPRNRGRVTTLVASLTLAGGMGPALTVEGGTTTEVFVACVDQVLAPALRPGQVVVLDNLAAHHGARARELVEAAGAELVFLPAYSPDLNPIEEAFSKVKAFLRKAEARTREALVGAIGRALRAVSPADARGFFAHCGYPPADDQVA